MPTYDHINPEYLVLMTENDLDMRLTLLEMLFDEIESEFELLQQAIVQHDYPQAKSVSHKMKSTLAFVGNPTLTEHNLQIEQACKNGGPYDLLPVRMQSILDLLPVVMQELKSYASEQEAANS